MAHRGQSGRGDRADITNPNDANFQSDSPFLHHSSVYGLSLCIQFLINMSGSRSLRSNGLIVMVDIGTGQIVLTVTNLTGASSPGALGFVCVCRSP